MKKTISTKNINELLEDAEFNLKHLKDQYLVKNGWIYTSETPGCYWRWVKKWEGKTLICNDDDAMLFEKQIQLDQEINSTRK